MPEALPDKREEASVTRVRLVVAALAVLFGALGLVVLFSGSSLGLPADIRRIVGSVLLLAALGDALVLYFLEQIVRMRR